MALTQLTCTTVGGSESQELPKKFTNTEMEYKSGLRDLYDITKMYLTVERVEPTPKTDLPVLEMTTESLIEETENVVYRLGHSSVLMKLDNQFVMTDPVFSDRASPVQWAGPKRFHKAPITIAELPAIDVVVISHDHYDHLDRAAVKELADKVSLFLVPLRVGEHLIKWGVSADKVIELNWWESYVFSGIEYTLTPTQHFSGRTGVDRDRTLWGSWVIAAPTQRVFFSGDSGYFSGFKEIGEKYGPFDLTLVETGAYNEAWSQIHMFPEQSVQAHIDLKGKVMFPIHNSTFDLATHDWQEPINRALVNAQERGVDVVMPKMGERLIVGDAMPLSYWWDR
ncbi:MBL fold metallo-hydrolase [Vibrio astriarenae]|uniref:MBL fold metallo-hydrolase n=1 Tax=Vibrio astriarenae TaxID=1481923 RepID=UPI003734F17F